MGNLHGDDPVQPGVAGLEDLAHSALADRRDHFIWTEIARWFCCHPRPLYKETRSGACRLLPNVALGSRADSRPTGNLGDLGPTRRFSPLIRHFRAYPHNVKPPSSAP